MVEKLRSLRVRVAFFATLAVMLALVAAALGLVFMVERTLLGRAKDSAIDQLTRVSEAVEDGRDPNTVEGAPFDVVVQVLDDEGNVLDMVPRGAPVMGEQLITERAIEAGGGVTGSVVPAPAHVVVRQLDSAELILAEKTVDSPDGERTIVAISPFSQIARSTDTVVNALWIGTPFMVAFVGLIAWYFTGRTLRPVDAMTRRAEAISHSSLGERLPTPGTADEIDRLAHTLNAMLDRLDTSARRQREFISDASHELRSPVAAIKAQVEVALAHPEASSWPAVGGRVLGETDRLERLVADILTLARADEVEVKVEVVDLAAVVNEEVGRIDDPRISANVSSTFAAVDRHQIERLIANLLDNARRYALSRVEVSMEVVHGDVVLAVDDDGPGIAPEDRERVFDRFTRLDAGRERATGGLGIGLALVKRIAESHGGAPTCKESTLGGARFEVRLPQA